MTSSTDQLREFISGARQKWVDGNPRTINVPDDWDQPEHVQLTLYGSWLGIEVSYHAHTGYTLCVDTDGREGGTISMGLGLLPGAADWEPNGLIEQVIQAMIEGVRKVQPIVGPFEGGRDPIVPAENYAEDEWIL